MWNFSSFLYAGVSSLINLLSSAQDEDQPKLNILLCEAVVAVYLSLLIHALATNSCNELFRLAAHPLNSRMWAAVFGGGVKLLVKPRRQSENIPGALFSKGRTHNLHIIAFSNLGGEICFLLKTIKQQNFKYLLARKLLDQLEAQKILALQLSSVMASSTF